MTREEALDKAAENLSEAEQAINDSKLSRHVTLAQMYLMLAHELDETK